MRSNHVVFLGFPDRSAGPSDITCVGTGFLLMYDGGFYLVTARHVAEVLGDTGFCTRVNTLDGGSRNLEPDHKVTWVYHSDPTVDVAIVGFGISRAEGFDFLYLDEILLIKEDRENDEFIETGDLCYTIGLWRLLEGKGRNLPIAHTGHIARLPGNEKIPITDKRQSEGYVLVDGYLVEAQTLSGLSGAPVFIRPSALLSLDAIRQDVPGTPQEHLKLIAYREEVALLGLWQAAWDAPASEVIVTDRGRQMTVPVGMGVVVPTSRIVEVLELPALKEPRETAKKARELANAAEPQTTGASRAEATVRVSDETNANPDHKEDFNRLVSAASKKRPPAD